MRALLVVILAASVAHAQPAPPATENPPVDPAAQPAEPTPAQKAFQEGRELLDAGRFDEACAKFDESLRLEPESPGTLLNLGLCNELRGKTATALRWYRKVQFRSAEALMNEYEEPAKQHAVQLAARVPTLRIDAPATMKVTLDGVELSEIDRVRVEVDPGTHMIQAGGEHRAITVKDGDKETITFAAPPPPKRFIVVDRGVKQRRYAYLAAGAGAGLVLASATLSLIGKSKYDATDHPETYQRWQNIVRFGGTSLFLAGGAAIAGGVYLYVKAPRKERIEQIAPIVARGQLGVAFVGSF